MPSGCRLAIATKVLSSIEMGITSPLLLDENTSNGNTIGDYDEVADPEDDGEDVRAFAEFMRATKAPPRDELSR